jgi:hypothetical protein
MPGVLATVLSTESQATSFALLPPSLSPPETYRSKPTTGGTSPRPTTIEGGVPVARGPLEPLVAITEPSLVSSSSSSLQPPPPHKNTLGKFIVLRRPCTTRPHRGMHPVAAALLALVRSAMSPQRRLDLLRHCPNGRCEPSVAQ